MSKFDDYYNMVMEATLGARIDPSSQKAVRDISVGQKAEDIFQIICKKNGLRAVGASLDQERNHIDFSVFAGMIGCGWTDQKIKEPQKIVVI